MSAILNPDIVTDGLVLCLDAFVSKSYPGDGNIWYDISGNNHHFMLINDVSFSDNGFNFAGGTAGQRVVADNTGLSVIDLTVEMGVKVLSNNGGYNGLFSGRLGTNNDFSNGLVLDLDNPSSLSFNRLNIESQSNSLLNRDALSADISFGELVCLSVTIDDSVENQYKIYINGELDYTNSYNGSTIYLDNISLGQRFYSGGYQAASCFHGVIYFLRVYNKALSYENINKNFQIIKQRFKL